MTSTKEVYSTSFKNLGGALPSKGDEEDSRRTRNAEKGPQSQCES